MNNVWNMMFLVCSDSVCGTDPVYTFVFLHTGLFKLQCGILLYFLMIVLCEHHRPTQRSVKLSLLYRFCTHMILPPRHLDHRASCSAPCVSQGSLQLCPHTHTSLRWSPASLKKAESWSAKFPPPGPCSGARDHSPATSYKS